MAQVIALRIQSQDLDLDGVLRIGFNCFINDPTNNLRTSFGVYVRVPDNVTPQQFRADLTGSILDFVAGNFQSTVLTASECLIPSVQRGN